jgi:penicillin-binding protein 1A
MSKRKSIFKTRSKDSGVIDPKSRKGKRLARKRERLSHLPKSRLERYKFYLLHPGELAKYWFSAEGARMLLKIFLGFVGLIVLAFIILYAVVSNEVRGMADLIDQRIQSTTNKYLDRNGELLWEDTGSGNILKFVPSDQISGHIKDATVAVEDREFYEHGGVSIAGIARALLNNFSGGSTQGGSTLTQQLMKQVFFADEAGERGIAGIPRKIKEAILAIEAERVYTKDEILTYYLNVAPYGGRRNGVQSAAETYFGKDAKDLTAAEAALIAGIPQYPSVYNPYNTDYNSSLIERYNIVLDALERNCGEQNSDADIKARECSVKYTAEDIATARKTFTVENLADVIKPVDSLLVGAKAPHFVQMVKSDLEDELGVKVLGQGGLTIKTTLDLRVQNIIDEEIDAVFASSKPTSMGFDNAAATMIDSQTGQILGMRGSRDYNFPDYGAVNAATSFIQPGSSIKPEVYGSLIDMQRDGASYGAGSLITDNDGGRSIQQIYGTTVHNANGSTSGSATIRNGLSQSLNIPAIMAMHFNGGAEPTIENIRKLGDRSYCTDGVDQSVGLAAAIGGCGAKQVEHANAFATFARMGTYKPYSDVLEVKDFQSNLLYKYDEEKGVEQVMDPQSAYIINDVLSDASARSATFGYCSAGFCIPGVKTATKTGTSDLGGQQKDLWMMSYTPKASFSMWWGNHIPKPLRYGDGMSLGPTIANIVGRSHRDVFAGDGTWKEGDWFTQPAGIQTINVGGRNDIFPSWYKKEDVQIVTEPTVFDRISKKLATDCTPEAARETLDVIKTINVSRNSTTYKAPDGYNRDAFDDVHSCSDSKPIIGTVTASLVSAGKYKITIPVIKGSSARNGIQSVSIQINDKEYAAQLDSALDWVATVDLPSVSVGDGLTVKVTAIDEALYSSSAAPLVIF